MQSSEGQGDAFGNKGSSTNSHFAAAPHLVPGTDLGPYLLASDPAPHLVPGTDFGPLFASMRPGVAPGAWHRFRAPVC